MDNKLSGVDELRRSPLCSLLRKFCGNQRVRRVCYSLAWRLEGGAMFSATLRDLLSNFYGIEVGAYSYGECMIPGAFPAGVSVGRYVSVASGVRVFLRNHPMERLSMHPFFYNAALGVVEEDNIPNKTLEIGDDAWIGERAMIMPGCRRIGLGAVVAAGAIVTKDVPDFAIVGGNPARLIRYRFDESIRDQILQSRWWERSLADLKSHLSDMVIPVTASQHPLLRGEQKLVGKA